MTRRSLALAALLVVLGAGPALALDGLQPGMKAPALSLEALDGTRVGLVDVRGARAYLLVFWAGWSQKSPEVLERAQNLHATYGGRGLVVLGVNVESPGLGADEVRAVKERVSRLGLTFPVLLDRGLQAFRAYGVVAVPSSVLVAPDQTVLAALAAFPIAGREQFFDQVEGAVTGRAREPGAPAPGRQPSARAVRYFNLGRDQAARGQVDQAAANLAKAIEMDAAFSLPRILLGQIWRERAQAREVIEVHGQAVPTLRLTDEERTRLLRGAAEHLEAAVTLDPRSPAALTELALLHAARDDRARARELLERALAGDTEHPPAQGHLGALLLASGDEARGRNELERALRLNPVDARLHAIAAQAYEARGLRREAAAAWKRAVDLLWQERRGQEASPR